MVSDWSSDVCSSDLRGSVTEVMSHGETGFIVNSIEEAANSVEKIETISRQCCRHMFETRFSARRMAQDYLKAYSLLIETSIKPRLVG